MINIVVTSWIPKKNQKFYLASEKGPSKIHYDNEHINIHFNMVNRHLHIPFAYHLFADREIAGLNENIIQHDLWEKYREFGGCYHRLYTFSKNMNKYFSGRFVSMDLDMIIVDDITGLITRKEDFVFFKNRVGPNPQDAFELDNLHPVGCGWRMSNSVYMMDIGARSFVWEDFDNDPEKAIEKRKGPGSDQSWCNYVLNLKNENFWEQGKDGIYDFRQDFLKMKLNKIPHNAKIVVFSGPRDPSQSIWKNEYGFLIEHWR